MTLIYGIIFMISILSIKKVGILYEFISAQAKVCGSI